MDEKRYKRMIRNIENDELTDKQRQDLIELLQRQSLKDEHTEYYVQEFQKQILVMEMERKPIPDIIQYIGNGVRMLVDERNHLRQAIYEYYDEVANKSKEYYEAVFENFVEIKAALESNPNPNNALAIVYLDVAIDAMRIASSVYNRYWNSEIDALDLVGKDILVNPKKALAQAGGLMDLRALSNIVHGFIGHSYSHSKNPVMICVLIIRLLNVGVPVPISFYEGLGDEWITNNLPESPAKMTTLKEGLEHAELFVASGLRQKEYLAKAELNEYPLVSERNLRTYLGWRDVILEWSQKPIPSFFSDIDKEIA